MRTLNDVDWNDPRLSETEKAALQKMITKREYYVSKGRAKEAHGAGSMILIFWDAFTQDDEWPSTILNTDGGTTDFGNL
jgi:hypothetical protein